MQGTHLGLETRRCLIFSKTRPVATIGLTDLVVVETPDVILICPKERAQDVRKLVERLRGSEEWRHLL